VIDDAADAGGIRQPCSFALWYADAESVRFLQRPQFI
jgi:hypothetical protein